MTTAVCQILRTSTLLLRKEKPTVSVTEWANASRQELSNIERTRSDRQQAQKWKAREIFDHIHKRVTGLARTVVDENETSLDFY